MEEIAKKVMETKKVTALGIEENIEGALCYLIGFITGIIFLILEKDNKFVRFHAIQSTATFLLLTLIWYILWMIPFIGLLTAPLIILIEMVLWLLLMYKAFNNEMYRLPIVGDFAAIHSENTF